MISISGHKIYGPKGVGALIVRRRKFNRLPLKPLFFGGGQERGLRPGTLPVPLVVGLGIASELALKHHKQRAEICRQYRNKVLDGLAPLNPIINGDVDRTIPHVVNISFSDIDSEAVMLAVKGIIAISNGSACTSQNYEPTHVLKAMGLPDSTIKSALRLSWCHMTEDADWNQVVQIISSLR